MKRAALALLVSSCSAETRIDTAPPLQPGIRSVIAVIVDDDQVSAHASTVDGKTEIAQSLEGDAELYLFQHEEPLSRFGLVDGALDLARPGDPGVSLPPPDHLLSNRIEGDRAGDWTDLPEVPTALLDLQLPRVPFSTCVDDGRCFQAADGTRAPLYCTVCPEPSRVEPPEPTAPPELRPCRPGWAEVSPPLAGDVFSCEPWGMAPAACGAGEVQFPGEAGCAPLGADCPAGVYQPAPPGSSPIYVALGNLGGDGSQANPFGSIQEGIDAGADLLVLSRGTFVETIEIVTPLHLLGACAAETTIIGSIEVTNSSATLENLTIESGGVVATDSALTVRGVLVRDAPQSAVRLTRSDGQVERAYLLSPGFDGLRIEGGSLNAEQVRVDVPALRAFYVSETATASIADCAALGSRGFSVQVDLAASASMTGCVFEGHRADAVTVTGAGSHLLLSDALVRRSVGPARGIVVRDRATAEVTRVLFDDNASVGAGVLEEAALDLEDVVVRETRPALGGMFGTGVEASMSGLVESDRLLLHRNRRFGVLVFQARADLRDVTVIDTRGQEVDGDRGNGVWIEESEATVARATLDGNRSVAFFIQTADDILVTDLTVRNTRGRHGANNFGRGFEMDAAVGVRLFRARFEDNLNAAMFVFAEGSTLEATDISIDGVTESACGDEACIVGRADGITANRGASATVTRFEITNALDTGLRVGGLSSILATDGRVEMNGTGASVSEEGFEPEDLAVGVHYSGNRASLNDLRSR